VGQVVRSGQPRRVDLDHGQQDIDRRVDRQLRSLLQERQRTPEAPQLKDLSLRVRSELTRAWRRFEDRL
jgi:hypothetical protein